MNYSDSNNANYRNEIDEFKKRNDWQSIYGKFAPIAEIKLWANAEILSEIGFACGMLAKVSAQDIPKKEAEKDKFLQQKAQYRNTAKKLRDRCLELKPNNVTYLANLAYWHYQNAMELKPPKIRRDGNLRQEAEAAIKYYDMALKIAPNRIKDYYRKGYLLSEIIPNTYRKDNNFELAQQRRQEGIRSFETAIQLWESLNTNHEQQNRERSRCRNEYIKSLYSIGSSYFDMIINKWDEAIFALGLRKIINQEDNVIYYFKDLENANKSWEYFQRCLVADKPSAKVLISTTNPAGVCETIDKLYSLGKVAFVQYWILSGNGQKNDKDVPEAIKYREQAEQYLIQALNLPWSQEKQRQKKDYIAQRLAQLYITKGKTEDYIKAVEVINKYQSGRLDPYILNTLALALILLGRHTEARRKLQEAINNRFNPNIWTSHFLMGCSFLREGSLADAGKSLQEAKRIKETDTILFGEALIAYKQDQMAGAIELIKQANQMNPYRVSIGKYLEKWSKGEITAVKPVKSKSNFQSLSQSSLDEDYMESLSEQDYRQYMYDALGYDEDMDMSFEHYLDTHGYL